MAIADKALKKALMLMLDEGEAAAIVLALEQRADLVLMDDYDGRAVAREYNLKVTGTIGILLRAKHEGRIAKLKHELDMLRNRGFWMSYELYMRLLKEANEA